MWNVLVRIMRDAKDSFRVRIAAAQVILDEQVSTEVLEQIRLLLPTETNSQVRNYVLTALRTISASHNPCSRLV